MPPKRLTNRIKVHHFTLHQIALEQNNSQNLKQFIALKQNIALHHVMATSKAVGTKSIPGTRKEKMIEVQLVTSLLNTKCIN